MNRQVKQSFQVGGIAKTKQQQQVGLNNDIYNSMSFPGTGNRLFRGLDSGAPVYIKDQSGKQKVLRGPQDTDQFYGHVQEQRMQTGGLWNTNKKEFVDSVMNANSDKNFVQRYQHPNNYPVMHNSDGSYSTHLMANDNDRVYPTIVQDRSGKLINLGGGDKSWDYANNTGEYIKLKTPEQAEWFANSKDSTSGYKMGTQQKQFGGNSNNNTMAKRKDFSVPGFKFGGNKLGGAAIIPHNNPYGGTGTDFVPVEYRRATNGMMQTGGQLPAGSTNANSGSFIPYNNLYGNRITYPGDTLTDNQLKAFHNSDVMNSGFSGSEYVLEEKGQNGKGKYYYEKSQTDRDKLNKMPQNYHKLFGDTHTFDNTLPAPNTYRDTNAYNPSQYQNGGYLDFISYPEAPNTYQHGGPTTDYRPSNQNNTSVQFVNDKHGYNNMQTPGYHYTNDGFKKTTGSNMNGASWSKFGGEINNQFMPAPLEYAMLQNGGHYSQTGGSVNGQMMYDTDEMKEGGIHIKNRPFYKDGGVVEGEYDIDEPLTMDEIKHLKSQGYDIHY